MLKKQRFITDWNEVPVVFDLAYASVLLGVTRDYLAKLCKKNEFPAFKVGREWRVDREKFMEYLKKRQEGCCV